VAAEVAFARIALPHVGVCAMMSKVPGKGAVDRVAKLKRESAKDLVIYGHISVAQVLLAHRLLDEIRLTVRPVLVGTWKLLFREGDGRHWTFWRPSHSRTEWSLCVSGLRQRPSRTLRALHP
jgi:dihydrofolate reductase